MKSRIEQVPTNIITGFLGTGKTSTIQHLLSFKPENERWAILVNEFGSVGIDGSIYQYKNNEEGGVFVREVPGGCMCCTSGLPMQIALNVLLKLSNPHRLLIEPSGLGHPVEVVSLLKSKYYKDVLDIQRIITLIDPKQFIQTKYSEHPTYQQQIEIADVCIINKTDLCTKQEIDQFTKKCNASNELPVEIVYANHGKVAIKVLNVCNEYQTDEVLDFTAINDEGDSIDIPELPDIPPHAKYHMSQRFDEGYHAVSWRYRNGMIFDSNKLLTWLHKVDAERIKGVLATNNGVVGINAQQGKMNIDDLDTCDESRLEIISSNLDTSWEDSLNQCVQNEAILGQINQFIAT